VAWAVALALVGVAGAGVVALMGSSGIEWEQGEDQRSDKGEQGRRSPAARQIE
jgi:hypothetical protein